MSNVVYRTSKPRYAVERRDVYEEAMLYSDLANGPTMGPWFAERGFASLENAQEYADQEQSRFPDSEFRIVDTQA